MASEKKTPFVVGVTGGIGSGKTAVTDYFASLGITIVDADVAARTVVEPGQPALDDIARHYGEAILLSDGNLNRRKLRDIIFNDSAEKQWLEKLLHPKINTLLKQQLLEATSPYTILVSPLLTETTQHTLCDHIVVIDVPEHIQVERTMARDNITEEQALKIIRSQSPREERTRFAHTVIENASTHTQLKASVLTLHNTFLRFSA